MHLLSGMNHQVGILFREWVHTKSGKWSAKWPPYHLHNASDAIRTTAVMRTTKSKHVRIDKWSHHFQSMVAVKRFQ